MRIITISREFGSGGRELGRRLADVLGFDYYDSEIISAVAQKRGMDAHYVERTLGEHGWLNYPITFRRTLGSSAYVQASGIDLLLEQKRVLEEIAALKRDCVIVGRNADVILQQYQPFCIFVCAEMGAKIKRCKERAPKDEDLSEKELVRKIRQIDKMRARTKTILSGSEWGQRDAYHLIVNTSEWNMKDMAEAVAEFANRFWRTTR